MAVFLMIGVTNTANRVAGYTCKIRIQLPSGFRNSIAVGWLQVSQRGSGKFWREAAESSAAVAGLSY
jgi:hypothetical protein